MPKKAKKAAVKKAAPKKAAKPKIKSKPKAIKSVEVVSTQKVINPENYFFLVDGRVLKDLKELADCLENVENHVFAHHVTDDRHDFANWIRDVFEQPKLANEISQIREPTGIQLVLLKHMVKKK